MANMQTEVYDPQNISSDAFDMANMVEAANAKIMTASERTRVFARFDTIASLQSDTVLSYTPGVGKNVVAVGQIVEADGFVYKVAASGASDHVLVTSGGVKLYLDLNQHLTLAAFGAVGDDDNAGGGTDDTDAIVKALSAGRAVWGEPGKIYKCLGQVQMGDNTSLNLQGSRINFYGNNIRCLYLGNYCTVENGTVWAFGGNPTAGDRVCPICAGSYSPVATVHDFIIRDVVVGSATANRIGIWAGSYNGVIENIVAPDGATGDIGGAVISVHWAGNEISGTVHPHNIAIRNVRCGVRTLNSLIDALVWLSGTYNVSVENCSAESVGTIVYIYCGDYGSEYASAVEKPLIGRGHFIANCSAQECLRGLVVCGDPRDSGLGRVAVGAFVTGMAAKGGVPSSNNCRSIWLLGAEDLVVSGCRFEGFLGGIGMGVYTNGYPSRRITITDCTFKGMQKGGLTFGLTASPPEDVLIENNRIIGCNTTNDTTVLGAGIGIVGSKRVVVRNNYIEGNDNFDGVTVNAAAVDPIVEHNYVASVASGRYAYNIAVPCRGGGNLAASGISLQTGTPITNCLVGSATVNLGSIAGGAMASVSVTVAGAALGDFVIGISSSVDPTVALAVVGGTVVGTNLVRLWVQNTTTATAYDPPSTTYTVLVAKRA